MNDDFWYPFYPLVFKRATSHLTAEQEGIYRRLIDYYMETREPIKNNDVALSRIAGVSIDCFKDASSIIKAFFKDKNGLLYHDFCDNQLDIQDKRSRKRSEIATKAANARHKKNKHNQEDNCIEQSASNGEAMHKDATGHNRTLQEDISKDISSDEKKIIELGFKQFWEDWNPFDMPKGSKSDALKNYKKTLKEIDHETIIRKRNEYLGQCHANKSKTKHAATWLSKRGWEDDYSATQIVPANSKASPDDGIRNRVNETARFINSMFED